MKETQETSEISRRTRFEEMIVVNMQNTEVLFLRTPVA